MSLGDHRRPQPARSRIADDHLGFTEVKGIEGAEEFWVTSTESLIRRNAAPASVSPWFRST